MGLSSIALHYTSAAGVNQTIELAAPALAGESSAVRGAIAMTVHAEHSLGGTMVRTAIENRGAEPVRLESARFVAATGFPPDAPARFFKHGYQSWTGFGRGHRRRRRSPFARSGVHPRPP